MAGDWSSVASCRSCDRLWESKRNVFSSHSADAATHRRSLAPQAAGDYETRAIAAREPAALSRTDGHRLRQDAPRHRLELPLDQVRRFPTRALSGGPRQPGETDPQGVSAVRLALQQLQIQRDRKSVV